MSALTVNTVIRGISHLADGVPVGGGELDYLDDGTVTAAPQGPPCAARSQPGGNGRGYQSGSG
jgi:hypothetical protein